MKRIVVVLLRPLATRLGTLALSGLSGAVAVDPAIGARVEAWVAAGVFLLADLLVAKWQIKTQEVR
nr:MAG: hypothetical protein [Microvirus sp.]